MRKDFFGRKGLGGLVYTVFEVKGLNLDRLINSYGKQGIALYDVKKYSNKRIRFAVKYGDGKKLFAITKEMCYNIRKVCDKGRGYPLLYLFRNIGVLIGIALFTVTAIILNDYVFSVDYTGSGSVYSREVQNYLSGRGVGVYSKFSDIDLDSLGEEIMSVSPRLSFAECRKDGNRLKIELILSREPPKTLNGGVTELKAEVSGVLENLKVYRGTAEVKVGDSVSAGDLLVGGYYLAGEERVSQNVIATATIRIEKNYEYVSINDNEEDMALLFAEQALNIFQPTDSKVVKTQTKDGFIYAVTLVTKRVQSVG